MMKRLVSIFIIPFIICILFFSAGTPSILKVNKGKASYYGKEFEGRKTANGEIFRNADFTAAHRTLPFNTFVRVTNSKNNLSITVRINDRGPFVKSRIIDLSEAAARRIGSYQHGLTSVKLEIMEILSKTREIDSIFSCEDVLDCLGNPEELSGISLSLWRSKDIVHMLYVANELYLHEDVEKVYIVGMGVNSSRIYHLVLSGFKTKLSASETISKFEKKGFMQIRFLKYS
jgi:rare lipoprotein A